MGGSCLAEARQTTVGLPPSSDLCRILKDVLNLGSWYFSQGQEAEGAGVQNKLLFPGLPLAGAGMPYLQGNL